MTTSINSKVAYRTARLCVTTALAAGLLSGCAAGGPHPSRVAAQAQSALGKGDGTKAIALAESAVLADPRNASYRMVLANAYLKAGRFESARQAYDEAMQLGEDGGKAALSLALADIAVGRGAEAADTLDSYRDSIPAADYGLAMAMAGRADAGIAALTTALRGGENTPKVRQNLAFAYALGGAWREARIMASQDVPANQLNDRLQQWAALANPDDTRTRVASLLGVANRPDSGQPQALALANFPSPSQLADAAAAKVEPAAEAPALARQAVEELPAVPVAASTPAPQVADASAMPAPAQLAALDKPAPRPAPAAAAPRPAATPAANGTHLVQLGAFSTPEGASRALRHFTARNPALASYRTQVSEAVVNGRKFWRVQAAGFAGFASAGTMCRTVKARGGVCLVMSSPRNAPASQQGGPADTRMARR